MQKKRAGEEVGGASGGEISGDELLMDLVGQLPPGRIFDSSGMEGTARLEEICCGRIFFDTETMTRLTCLETPYT